MVSTLLTFANGGAKGLRAKSTSTFGVPVAPALRSVGTAGQHSDQRASTLLAAELGLFDWVFVLSFGQSAWEMRPSSDQEAWEKPGKRIPTTCPPGIMDLRHGPICMSESELFRNLSFISANHWVCRFERCN